jgi:uncharacterized delta-60 repeat protein
MFSKISPKLLFAASSLFILTATLALSAQPGSLDTSFGIGGVAAVECPSSPAGGAVQSDGRILVLSGSPYASRLVRFNKDGSLDDGTTNDTTPGDSFGSGGMISITWPGVNGSGWPRDLALQTVGGSERIVLAGYAAVTSRNKLVDAARVERFMLDGSLDTSFGNLGTASFAGVEAASIAVQADQKIVLSGASSLYRLNANGTTDTSFGSGGKASTPIAANAVAVLPNGKIVVAGSVVVKNKTFAAVARHNANGSLDQAFGSGGKTTIDFAGGKAWDVLGAADGTVYAGGTSGTSTLAQNALVVRLTSTGQLDAGFGSGGVSSFDSGIGDVGWRIGLQPDGKVLVAGNVIGGAGSTSDLLTARFDSAGNLDFSFGTYGGSTLDLFNAGETSRGVFIQNLGTPASPDYRIVVTGMGNANGMSYAFAVRYNY